MRPTRLERATYGFEVRCSIQLSYKRIFRHAKNAAYSAAFFIFPHERKKGWVMGFEPTTTRSTIWRSTTELHPPSKAMQRLLQITKKKSSRLLQDNSDIIQNNISPAPSVYLWTDGEKVCTADVKTLRLLQRYPF